MCSFVGTGINAEKLAVPNIEQKFGGEATELSPLAVVSFAGRLRRFEIGPSGSTWCQSSG
jgi:hypothetical protein